MKTTFTTKRPCNVPEEAYWNETGQYWYVVEQDKTYTKWSSIGVSYPQYNKQSVKFNDKV